MQKQKRQKFHRMVIPEAIKRKRLKYIAILPSSITLLNALCGFLSIVFASRGPGTFWQGSYFYRTGISYFALAGYMLFFAMIADMLDGRVARLSGTTSSFGGQLDSLSDAISFGVAPAFLMIRMVGNQLAALRGGSFPLVRFLDQSVLFIAVVYALCAVIRLARFNVENDERETAHMDFAGLPSPAAAGMLMSLVIFREDFLPGMARRFAPFLETPFLEKAFLEKAMDLTIWILPPAALLAGILMVSRVSYPHALNRLLRGKKSFITFLLIFFLGLLVILNLQIAMALGFWGFALAGVFRALFLRIRVLRMWRKDLRKDTASRESPATEKGAE
ncbi:MAG: CDP-alcohol phosphatidyltransferase family protein [Treponema sp.]|jgi:CDP-diacylglycerol--serine O-phosphatidyltransferase|nr:CDP-alcohol phosphatidyltransferase family protein [Treponema sp.]